MRWNSHYYAFEVAICNHPSINNYSAQETRLYNKLLDQIREKNWIKDPVNQYKEPRKSVIAENALSNEDWNIVTKNMEVLKLLMLATKKLEGKSSEGKIIRASCYLSAGDLII